MPFITMMQQAAGHQVTFEEILAGEVDLSRFYSPESTNTRTYYTETLKPKLLENFDIHSMIMALKAFNRQCKELFKASREDLYETFHIPKKSGGLRRIDAPKPELMAALRNLKIIFETKMFALYHTSAYGYIKGRSTLDAIKRHQKNSSHWFLKIDFSNFFGNSTPEFVYKMVSSIFPFSEIVKVPDGKEQLEKALSLCFLNSGLPQGTPISPMLTNLMMIPIDYRLSNKLRDFNGNSYVYTRYADDLLISSRKGFNQKDILDFVAGVLNEFQAPFSFKEEKTRYGSRAGSNWNLGLMLNKDNEITIGHKNKKRFRAMISNYILDHQSQKKWDIHDVQVLSGLISYYIMVEKPYVTEVLDYNNNKYSIDVMALIKSDLN